MRIDLHAHSSASDGTETPADLVRAAADAGLDVVALTDHDTVRGWAAATEALPPGLRLVRGAEISCVYDGVSLHLLAYLFDPEHEALAEEMSMALDDRVPRAKAIVGKLAAAGHPITWELVLAQLQDGATVGRPHIADTLVAVGVVPDRDRGLRHPAARRQRVLRRPLLRRRRPRGPAGPRGRGRAGLRPPRSGQAWHHRRRRRDRGDGRCRAGRARGRPPRQPARGPRPAARTRGRPRPAGDRRERLPRHRQGEPARREHHRPRGAHGAARPGAQRRPGVDVRHDRRRSSSSSSRSSSRCS